MEFWIEYQYGFERIEQEANDPIITLNVSTTILALISELDEFKGAWQAIGRITPERLSSLRHVATIESIDSSTRI